MSGYEKLPLVLATVLFMKVFAPATQNYVMHGRGWRWHRLHHEPHEGAFRRNDLYAVTFAVIVFAMFALGALCELVWWVALGITVCGAIYALVHDMLVHQRFGARWFPRRGYLKRLHQAHRRYPAVKGKEGDVGFGFLFAPDPVRLTCRPAERNRR